MLGRWGENRWIKSQRSIRKEETKLKIRTRLLLGLCTLPLFLLVVIGVGRLQLANFNEINETTKGNYDRSILAETIQRDIKDEAISLRNLLIYTNDKSITNEVATLQEVRQEVLRNIDLLHESAYTAEQKKLVEELEQTNTHFNSYVDEMIELISTGKLASAKMLMEGTSEGIHSKFFALTSEITTTFESNMNESLTSSQEKFEQDLLIESMILVVMILLIMILLFRTVMTVTSRLNKVSSIMNGIANGQQDLNTKVEVLVKDEIGDVAKSFNLMTSSLEEQKVKERDLVWTKSHIADITTSISGSHSIESLAEIFLSKVVPLVGGSHAVFYVKENREDDREAVYKLRASYAFKERKHMSNEITVGEGLIGQAVLEKAPIILSKVPSDYITVKSGLGEATPLNLYVLPILFEDEVKGVFEIASFQPFTETQQDLLEDVVNDLGIILDSVLGRIRLAQLLEESQTMMEEIQAQSEELQSQQDELKATNEELEQQTITLRQSEERLQLQQEELEQTNVELEEKAFSLSKQNKEFEQKNKELELARAELEEKAKQLALSSKYKSEFLANMSHELRTPLNSMLILSSLLAENKEGTFTSKQVEFAKTIHSSGKELLSLINDILDLSKIESGKADVRESQVCFEELAGYMETTFRPIAEEKEVEFNISLSEDLPSTFLTDEVKIQQILKNLLSNAFKFTDKGRVSLTISLEDSSAGEPSFVFTVDDTGIGISNEQQELIFEAFQQVDGTTSRKYGGTGLGLSISKELASLLNGKIVLYSVEGKGSSFSLVLKNYVKDIQHPPAPTPHVVEEAAYTVEEDVKVSTTPTLIEPKRNVEERYINRILIVDDDLHQRNSLMELIADMDVIMKAVSSGKEALEELKRNTFDCIVLDLGLKDTDGYELIRRVKESYPEIRIFVYTGRDLSSKEENFLNKYARTIIIKDQHSPTRLKKELYLFLNETESINNELQTMMDEPVDSSDLTGKNILVIDDDVRNVFALSSILELHGMHVCFAENGLEGLEQLNQNPSIDLIIMDIMMPEMDGYETIRRIRENPAYSELPIISLTAKAMKEDRENSLKAGASDYIVKPVDTKQLISLMKVWLFKKERIVFKHE